MIILSKEMTLDEISKLTVLPNGFIKGVVDVKKELVALEADMHYQLPVTWQCAWRYEHS